MFSRKWLIPGMQVKRWLVLLLSGVTLLALGIADLLIHLYETAAVPARLQTVVGAATLQFLPQATRAGLFGLVGIGLATAGLVGLNRSLVEAARSRTSGRLVDLVDRRRRQKASPKIVAIGGGTGLSTLLRGLKHHTGNITAVVTVADDGGSSGRLRRSLGVQPPGDFRQCIAALAETEPLMESLFQYRFGQGELGGHAFGNLFIVAMVGITGSFESALRAASRVLAVAGRIVPSTTAHVTLYAELADDRVMAGESNVPHGDAPIRRVFLEPASPPAFPEAVAAILDADLVVLGPGSLYTSVLPNLLVPDIAAALAATAAPVVYVANVATQPGETDGYDLADHLDALRRHIGDAMVDYVLANADTSRPLPAGAPVTRVMPALPANGTARLPRLVTADVASPAIPTHHDPARLAEAVMRLARPSEK
ncbi:hypothetical protein DCC79_11150 [bacterium]|nr:YvcK family protein [Chloroflexi bacterium CFX6]RIL09404.1 MAG: hypothetical protein DCC79_11150 [bacterium]